MNPDQGIPLTQPNSGSLGPKASPKGIPRFRSGLSQLWDWRTNERGERGANDAMRTLWTACFR